MKPEKEDHIYSGTYHKQVRMLQMKHAICQFLFVISCTFICLAQATDSVNYRYFNNFEDSALNSTWMNSATVKQDLDSSGNHFSKTDGMNPYSSGIEIEIPDGLKGRNFKIEIKGSIRSTNTRANNQLVISIAKADSSIFWKGLQVCDSLDKINRWKEFNISTLIPGNIPGESSVKIFFWNAGGDAIIGLDNMDIYFKVAELPSFLPQ